MEQLQWLLSICLSWTGVLIALICICLIGAMIMGFRKHRTQTFILLDTTCVLSLIGLLIKVFSPNIGEGQRMLMILATFVVVMLLVIYIISFRRSASGLSLKKHMPRHHPA